MKTFREYFIKNLKDWFLALWGLPQNLIGFIVLLVTGAEKDKLSINGIPYTYYLSKRFNNIWSGVSLGDYIIFAKDNFVDKINIRHEYGHQKQSFILGPLYLIVVGLPSLFGNIWDRIAHRNWSCLDRVAWYYTQPVEHWADSIAHITLEDRGV